MGVGRFLWRSVKPFVNVPKFMGWNEIKHNTRTLKDLMLTFFKVSPPSRPDTFASAVKANNLSEKDLEKRAKSFLYFSIFYFLIAIGFFIYFIYLWAKFFIFAGFISFLLMIIALLLGYRDNFWWFQVKQRRLGCTFREWLNFILRIDGKTNGKK